MKAIRLAAVGLGAERAPKRALDVLARALPRIFRVPCEIQPGIVDADEAYDPTRHQYYSTEILRCLVETAPRDRRVLGVTTLDLYVPVLTFVFGEAQLEGNCAVVSTHRLEETFYGLPPNQDLADERLVKEAAHELGHTFGLRHCVDWNCVMASSHGVELLDVKSAEFCLPCARVVTGGGAAARTSGSVR
ncbi:MAG TPA: archaemetzincin family Zn-dependent metalloprotease [Bryobacteraceae bacterium]|nr:archaemetzincin family Zn-dependent metalloprotease [Bryobacteraceae bacterium]